MSRKSILIVDDEPLTMRLLGNILQEQYDIYVATQGRQALQRANKNPRPDLVLLDIMLPDTDGYEVCVLLKDNPDTRDIPVIFLTARDSEEDETRGLEVGAADFITKPIRPDILQARIRTQLMLQEQRRRLQERESLLKATLDSTRDGILVLDNLGYILLHNERLLELWDITEETLIGRDVQPYLQQLATGFDEGMDYTRSLHELLLSDLPRETVLTFRDGRFLNEHSMPLLHRERLTGRVFSYTDITDQKLLEVNLRERSITDELTGLYNRRQMDELLDNAFRQARALNRDLAILFIDVDNFKRINDEFGHDAGDCILKELAKSMQEYFRNIDYCCRFGGDEFCVVMPSSNEQGTINAAERFRIGIERSRLCGHPVTVSVGAATLQSLADEESITNFRKRADQALYKAKQGGRNCVHLG
jgi:two-component system cell cycle response regulator